MVAKIEPVISALAYRIGVAEMGDLVGNAVPNAQGTSFEKRFL
jgi:hypothetical protein